MHIGARYSHLNGYEWLLVHRPAIWDEIEDVIGGIDADRCRTKISQEKRSKGNLLYAPADMNNAFKTAFEGKGWSEHRVSYCVTDDAALIRRILHLPYEEQRQIIEQAGNTPIPSYNQTDFQKDRVSIEIQFGKYAFVAYDVTVKHLAFYVSNVIDVGIEILPMKCLQKQMSSGVPYYEKGLYDIVRQGRGSPAVPLVLLGIEP